MRKTARKTYCSYMKVDMEKYEEIEGKFSYHSVSIFLHPIVKRKKGSYNTYSLKGKADNMIIISHDPDKTKQMRVLQMFCCLIYLGFFTNYI